MKAQDEKDFDNIFWENKDMVFNTARKYFKREQDAEDIVQEVFLKVYLHFSSFQKKSSLKTWIYRIALNEIYSRFRKEKKHLESLEINENMLSSGDDLQVFRLEQKEMEQKIWKQIQKMPKKRGRVVFLRLSESLSFKEIGETLDVSEDSAKNLFSIGIRYLKKQLETSYAG